MRPILTFIAALTLTACGGGGEPQPSEPPVKLAPATPVICQTVINGVVHPCGS